MKKIVGGIITIVLTIGMCMPVLADISDSESHTNSIKVSATLTSCYTVTLPADLSMVHDNTAPENNQFKADYKVKASGLVADASYVQITPASTFELVDKVDTTNKVTATVTQDAEKWARVADTTNNIIALGTETDGNITAVIANEGTYEGTLVFTYQMKHK